MEELKQQIGERIALARKACKLGQTELAARIGVSGQTISNWENGRYVPDANAVVALVTALGCTSDFLLGLSNTLTIRDR